MTKKLIEFQDLTCVICHKKHKSFGFICSEKCGRKLAKIICVCAVAGVIIDIFKGNKGKK